MNWHDKAVYFKHIGYLYYSEGLRGIYQDGFATNLGSLRLNLGNLGPSGIWKLRAVK